MYIQITTRCNMRCAHCCMSCGPDTGEHMSEATFHRAIRLAQDYGELVALGGGEPTIHPKFEKFLMYAIAQIDDVLVITNGKHTQRALLLAALANRKMVNAELSVDRFHEPVDMQVREAFYGSYRNNEARGKPMLLAGRNLELRGLTVADIPADEPCCCDDWIVTPRGKIRQCGCHNAPVIGNVVKGFNPAYELCGSTCHRSREFRQAQEPVPCL